MRTITKSNMKRLIAQRDEAKMLGFDKVAVQLTDQIAINNTREDSAEYQYSYAELNKEVKDNLWDVAIRAQDYFGKFADARDIDDIVNRLADDFVEEIGRKVGAVVGAYEASLPGESSDSLIEVSENE